MNEREFLLDLLDKINYRIGEIDYENSVKSKISVIDNVEEHSYTLSQWLQKWFELYKSGNKESTKQKQINIMKRIAKSNIGKVELKEITPLMIQDFLLTIKRNRQREHFYTLLKDALNKAYIADVIHKNISKQILLKKTISQETMVFTLKQQEKFEQECMKNKKYFLLLLLYTGLRPCELKELKCGDVDLVNASLSVRKSKTINGVRLVPLTDKALALCKNILENRIEDEPLLSRKDYSSYNADFKQVCEKIKVEGFIPYSLRHTFATRCVEQGVSSPVLKQWLGHSDIKITLRYYTKVTDDFSKFNFEKIKTQ